MPTYKTPDVYIEEFEPAAPIAGVGTSTASFLGPCTIGPLNEATRINSWDQFRQLFGEEPVPGMYLWYAVRGFYENGGKEAYVTRVSNATYSEMTLNDATPSPTLLIQAREAGVLTPGLTIAVDDNVHSVDAATARLFRPTGTIANAAQNSPEIMLTTAVDASRFRPGDRITWAGVAAADDNAIIARVRNDTLEILKALSQAYPAGAAVRLANPPANADVLRLENAAKVAPGMVLVLSQALPAVVDETVVVQSVIVESISGALTTYRITLRDGLTTGFDFGGGPVTAQSHEFRLTVTPTVGSAGVYDELGMDPEHPRYYAKVVNGADPYVTVRAVSPPNTTPPPDNRPATMAAAAMVNGLADNPATLTSADYNAAIDALEAIDDVNIIAVPDRTDKAVQDKLIGHCTTMQDRFAVLSTAAGLEPYGAANSAMAHRAGLVSDRGYAALYYPWIQIFDNRGDDMLVAPPVGHVMGVYARTDEIRGVHKAPAGLAANLRRDGRRRAPGVRHRAGRPESRGRQRASRVRQTARRRRCGARARWRRARMAMRTGSTSTSGGCSSTSRSRSRRACAGRCSSPTTCQLWQKLKRTLSDFLTRHGATARCSGRRPRKRSTCASTRR